VKRWLDPEILVRLLIPLILIPLLGITPRSHEVVQDFWEARGALESGSTRMASTYLARAAERLPWRADLWQMAGKYALQGGSPQAAIHYFEQAAERTNLSPDEQVLLGDAYQQVGDLTSAIRTWQAILDHQADPGDPQAIYTRLLNAHLQLEDYPGAINDLKGLVAIQPADPQLRYQLGLLLAAEHPEAALPYLSQASELDPALEKDAQTLVSSIRTASLADDPAYMLLASGRSLASLNQWKLAAEAFTQATQERPDYAEAWAYLGEACQHLSGNPDQEACLPDLQKALSLDPASLAANTLMALYWQRLERQDRALEYLEKAIKLDPRNPVLQVQLGSTLAVQGNLTAALQAYQHALELAPQDPTYPRLLAVFSIKYEYMLRQVGLPAARQALLLAPDDPACLDVMGQILILLEDTTNAERFLLRSIQSDPNYAPAHLHLGTIYTLRGDKARAIEQLKLASTLAPGSPTAEQAQRLLGNYFP
jgi:tetratricopeptide (TPR) repeat protein